MRRSYRALGKGALVLALTGALTVGGAGLAFASDAAKGSIDYSGTAVDTPDSLLTTASVRAGSAGPDFLGITNTNYDFQPSHTAKAGDPYPYYFNSSKGWGVNLLSADHFNRLAIWGTGVNQNANPYYQNLLVNFLMGSGTKETKMVGGLPYGYTMATTYHSNKEAASWGDVTLAKGQDVISQDLVFGANKITNWNSNYNEYTETVKRNPDATYVNNDSTNIWTQIYTIEQMAAAADDMDKIKRYNGGSATPTAVDYERAIKGQMLYVASQLDKDGDGVIADSDKKTVAYLYAIQDGTGYFFVPGTDTAGSLEANTSTTAGIQKSEETGEVTGVIGDTDYVSNNSTINMGYMATLPFVTNTFDSEEEFEGGIVMKVEDIWKSNPACTVSSTTDGAASILDNVDVIIYNSTSYKGYEAEHAGDTDSGTMAGTNNGRNSSGVGNTKALNNTVVEEWAKNFRTNGNTEGLTLIAGDDFGTGTKQQSTIESAPILYCGRNYTVDKNTRAAWAWSKVFPELYGYNDDATYAYWLEKIYHIQTGKVNSVVAAYTHQDAANVKTYANNAQTIAEKAEEGYSWYQGISNTSDFKSKYAYYTGATRAYWYAEGKFVLEAAGLSEKTATAEQKAYYEELAEDYAADDVITDKTIGIFAPSKTWEAASHDIVENASVTPSASKTNVQMGEEFTVALTVDDMNACLSGDLVWDDTKLELVKIEAGNGLNMPEGEGAFENVAGNSFFSFWGNTAQGEGVVAVATFKALYPTVATSVSVTNLVAGESVGSTDLVAVASNPVQIAVALPGMLGDPNNSGKVNIVDAQITYDLSCNKYVGEPLDKLLALWPSGATLDTVKTVADVNLDGTVTAADAFAIQYAIHHGGFSA